MGDRILLSLQNRILVPLVPLVPMAMNLLAWDLLLAMEMDQEYRALALEEALLLAVEDSSVELSPKKMTRRRQRVARIRKQAREMWQGAWEMMNPPSLSLLEVLSLRKSVPCS